MDHAGVFRAFFLHELADRLIEGLRLDVTDRPADFYDRNVSVPVQSALDLIGHMWNHLYRPAAVVPVALLIQHRPVDFAGRHIGIIVQALIDESLVVTKIQIRLGTVVRHKHLAVLDRIHRTGIDVQVRVKFLHRDLIAARLQKPSQRRRRDALPESRYNAACNKYIFRHVRPFLIIKEG